MIRGKRIQVPPTSDPRADMRSELNYLVGAGAAPGYIVATDLLTRAGPSSDFATDLCVRREGTDPQTGRRYLEELAFVVVSGQEPQYVVERMEDLSLRGVRRLFGVFVDEGQVCEWSAADHCFAPLAMDSDLVDPALVIPVPLVALFGSADRHGVVLSAEWAKGDPVRKRRGMREIARGLLRAQGLHPDAQQEAKLYACGDVDRLERWALASLTVSSVSELLELP